MGKYLLSYRDWGNPGEVSTVTIPCVDLHAGNIVEVTTKLEALRAALEAITLGGNESKALVAWVNDAKSAPAGPRAQREIKWLVKYHEVTGGNPTHYLEIPCADLDLLDPDRTDAVDMSHESVVAFVEAFEAAVTVNEHAVVVDDIIYASRKS